MFQQKEFHTGNGLHCVGRAGRERREGEELERKKGGCLPVSVAVSQIPQTLGGTEQSGRRNSVPADRVDGRVDTATEQYTWTAPCK